MVKAAAFYVYEWFIVDTGEVFYVGKGSGKRATSMKDRNYLFKEIRRNHDCDYRIVARFDDEAAAFNCEKERGLELKALGQARANFMLGAENRYTESSVYDKMEPTWFPKGHTPWNRGKTMDESFRNKCRERQLGKLQSDATKAKRSKSLMGHQVTLDARNKIANARKKQIVRIDVQTGERRFYDSISDFAKETGVSLSAISRPLKTGKPYKGGIIQYVKQANPESV